MTAPDTASPLDLGPAVAVRAPSAYSIERAVSAVQQAWESLRTDAADGDDYTDDADANLLVLEAASLDLQTTVRRLLLAATEAKANSETVKQRMDALADRGHRFDRHALAWREAALSIIQMFPDAFPKGKFKDALVSASVMVGKPGVVITDDAAIPDEYVHTKREPKKTLIRDDLLQGVVIPGAELRNPMPYITIRTA